MLGRTRPPDGAQPRMQAGTAQKVSNAILSGAAGVASFIFSLSALLYITELNEKIVAALIPRIVHVCKDMSGKE